MKNILTILLLLTIISCKTTVTPLLSNASKSDATIVFSYKIKAHTRPVEAWSYTLIEAKNICKQWNYNNVQVLNHAEKRCIDRSLFGCKEYEVFYKCLCLE